MILSAYNKLNLFEIIQLAMIEELNGATIFWLITLGLITGAVMKTFLGEERGLGMPANLIGGVLSTLVVGILSIQVQVPGSLLLGLMGTMAILFLGNVFYMEDEHPNDHQQRPV